MNSSYLATVVIVVVFGCLVWGCVQSMPLDYWILKDGAETTALVTDDRPWVGYRCVVYSYTVNGQEYTGKDRPVVGNSFPKIGDKCTVYYSVSHPWYSLLRKPERFIDRYAAGIMLLFIFSVVAIFDIVGKLVRRFRRRRYPPLPNVRRP
jgi:hypothetical protein